MKIKKINWLEKGLGYEGFIDEHRVIKVNHLWGSQYQISVKTLTGTSTFSMITKYGKDETKRAAKERFYELLNAYVDNDPNASMKKRILARKNAAFKIRKKQINAMGNIGSRLPMFLRKMSNAYNKQPITKGRIEACISVAKRLNREIR